MIETTLIRKILIANRGEIAIRVIQACRELGIETVALYSEVDRASLHVRQADEAYFIGGARPSESYLAIDKILDVARRSGADAIHPGYGFLAERADFAQACGDEGLVFIGPRPHSIALMGDKVAARELMRNAGVPIIPGTRPGLTDDEMIAAAEREVGFPLMVKAAAGGGGKGIRTVQQPEALPQALAAARREAEAAFGDGTVYLERLIEGARHIEIQVLADAHGNTIHLGERECSIQRRHQKLFEEAPSMFVDEDMRQRMGEVAVRAAQAVEYLNAGTVEFLVDREKNFYFLEMNTRIQVEHPVTELVTGVDLVKEQIRIARGRRMGPTQDSVVINGWAVECRINAEDPYRNFMPSVGRITAYLTPTGPGVRVDSGVYAGHEVTPYYDSLLAKLICWGETRGEALLRMRRALSEYRIMGVNTNIPFHQSLIDSHRFLAGSFDTSFVEERFEIERREASLQPELAAIMATLVAHRQRQHAAQIVQGNARDVSNWKWYGRWERLRR